MSNDKTMEIKQMAWMKCCSNTVTLFVAFLEITAAAPALALAVEHGDGSVDLASASSVHVLFFLICNMQFLKMYC